MVGAPDPISAVFSGEGATYIPDEIAIANIQWQKTIHAYNHIAGQFSVSSSPAHANACLWTVGGSQSTQREATQEEGESLQNPRRKGPSSDFKHLVSTSRVMCNRGGVCTYRGNNSFTSTQFICCCLVPIRGVGYSVSCWIGVSLCM